MADPYLDAARCRSVNTPRPILTIPFLADYGTATVLRGLAGVYDILHRPSGRRYIGASRDLFQRLRGHKYALGQGDHYNDRLQNDWRADGAGAFELRLLRRMHKDDLKGRVTHERALIGTLALEDRERLYNVTSVPAPWQSPCAKPVPLAVLARLKKRQGERLEAVRQGAIAAQARVAAKAPETARVPEAVKPLPATRTPLRQWRFVAFSHVTNLPRRRRRFGSVAAVSKPDRP